jgi:signal transduction histidine kinase/ligand-binding sensor domain-containing protein/CheY-like chemotaxis protein/AraC-like DNA-binding protein
MKSNLKPDFKGIIKEILIFLLISSFNHLSGTDNIPEKLHFKTLTIENGLSGNIINRIIEDYYGYIWIATPNGLNRYDGYKVTVFYYNPLDTSSIPNNEISSFAVDKEGDFWIGTKTGLCRFNYESERFERHLQQGPGERNSISSLFVDAKDQLWVGTENGLFRFDKKAKEFIKMIVDDELNLNAPLSFAEHSNGTLLLGTWERGFYRINENRRNYSREIISLPGNSARFDVNTIETILIDKNNTVWMGTRGGVIKAYESSKLGKNTYDFSLFQQELSPGSSAIDPPVHALCEDNKGRIWIGTENGLNIYDPVTHRNFLYLNIPADPNSLSNNHIKCIFKDRNGNIWMGTYQGGVNIFSPNQDRFQNSLPAINNAADQKIRYVKSILQDSKGTIWIGTDLGLLEFTESGQLIKKYVNNPGDLNSINIGGVTAILEDKKGRIWIGTWGGGLHELNRETGLFKRLPYIDRVHDNSRSQGDVTVRSIAEDSQGNLWIGNVRGYLDKYNPETKVFEHFRIPLNELDINAVILIVNVDKGDNVWIGTQGGGLFRLDAKTKNLKRFGVQSNSGISSDSSLTCTDVYSLFFSDDNQLWLGTNNGIQILNVETNRVKSFTTKDGLPSNTVYCILMDDFGYFWISTLNGISRFNPDLNVFINYDRRDGIRINSENGFKSSSGWLFFGGVNGINAINPASIKENLAIPPIVFTDFRIFNKSIEIGEKSILKKSINLNDEIVIDYNQNVFSIEFAALNYINSEKNQYKCKLDGFDKDWVLLGSAKEARYTNLSPGDYSFHVIASNNDGVWNEKGRILKIKILPPWYQTWWFKLIALMSLFLIILSWILVRTFRLRDQQRKLKKLVQERTLEIETQQVKLQQQADMLLHTNQLLVDKQNEVLAQKESIALQNEKLEVKNHLLEDQKNQISAQRQKEQEMAGKLHEADQMKLRFFTNISHEFRTPLTLILGPIEKLLSEFSSHQEFTELGKVIQRNTLRLLNLINQFLDISRFEAGVVKLNISRGDIFTYINGIVNAYQFAAKQKNIEYVYISDVDSHECFFDADKIEKIMYNLLSNAFKFTMDGGKIEVSVKLLNENKPQIKEADTIRITISDTGKGISPAHLKRIFERFYQVDQKEGHQVSGTGIGLALTHDLVAVYNGTIDVESLPGKGTTFIVSLPINKSSFKEEDIIPGLPVVDDLKRQLITVEDQNYETAHSAFDSSDEDSVEVNGEDKRYSIMIVDDNRDIRKYLIDNFGNEYRIIEARDGTEGLEKALKYLPKLVICDVMMPNMNGYELCAHLKTDLRTCHIPVIILTAKASPEDQLESLETGADAFISKPFDIKLLETQVRQLISGREQLKQLFKRELVMGPSDIVVESSDEKLMNRIIKVMSENISNPDFGVEELGREVGLSRTHLYRKLKQFTNHTAIEFVRNMRLQRAAQLFKQNKLYVAEVAYMSGFKELSYFRKIFREFYGMSPQEYVNSCNKEIVR